MVSAFQVLWISSLFFLVYLVFKFYWKFQLTFDRGALSLYTPPEFGEFSFSTQIQNQKGFDIAKRSKLIIATMVRDVESMGRLDMIRKKAESLGKMFKDYVILIVENDSIDNTRKYLLEWSKENSCVIVLGCGVNAPKCSLKGVAKIKTDGHNVNRARIQKMVDLRNIYLEYAKTHYSTWEFMAIWDLDIIGSVYLDGVANSVYQIAGSDDNSIELPDAVCANGIYTWGPVNIYYDTYAHIDIDEQYHVNYKLFNDIRRGTTINYNLNQQIVPVKSCFSGFTLYNFKNVCKYNAIYDMTPIDENKDVECEHVRFHKYLKNIFINPNSIHHIIRNE